MKKLSIVVPCYNEEESIPLFYNAVEKVMQTILDLDYEYWFVNDGSSDKSLEEMRQLQKMIQNMSIMSRFHVILVKKQHFMQACRHL